MNSLTMLHCKICDNSENQFVHDVTSDNWVCTICGYVETAYWNPGSNNVNYQKNEEDVVDSFEDKIDKNIFYRLMVRAHPKDEMDRKRKQMIKNICYKIDAASIVQTKSLVLYETHKEELIRIKPIKKMLLACVVVASRSSNGIFIPMSIIKNMYVDESVDINTYTKKVCKIIGMNQKTFSLAAVPFVVGNLGFSIKYEAQLRKNFERIELVAPSMAPETRLAIATCKLLKDNNKKLDLSYIADITDSSLVAINTFINKNRKRQKLKN